MRDTKFNMFKNRVYRFNKKLKKASANYWCLPQNDGDTYTIRFINANTRKTFKTMSFDPEYVTKQTIDQIIWHIQHTHKAKAA